MSEKIEDIIGEEEFEAVLGSETKPVVADFWATWCGPCRMQAPILEQFAEECAGKARVIKVNVDENEALADKLKISSIPTLCVFKGGELKEKSVGLTSAAQLSELVLRPI